MKLFRRRAAACVLAVVMLLGIFPSGAAFSEHKNWIENNTTTLNEQFRDDLKLTVLFYRSSCGNSQLRRTVLEDVMDKYNILVDGINIDQYSLPAWFRQEIGYYLTLPGIAVTQSSSKYSCFTGADSMRWVMEALYQRLGIYDGESVDFSALNAQIMGAYSQRAAVARALYLSDDEDTREVFTGLAYGILDEAGAVTDLEKAQAIYNWVCTNLRYAFSVKNRPQNTSYTDPVSCYWGKSATSEGFANLTAELCWGAGLPCRVVKGFALGTGYADGVSEALSLYETYQSDGNLDALCAGMEQYANHWWNEVYVDGRWIVMDTALGGNTDIYTDYRYYMRGPADSAWFDPAPDLFNRTHLTWTAFSGDLTLTRDGRSLTVTGYVDETQSPRAILAVYGDGKMLDCTLVDVSGGMIEHTFPRVSKARSAVLYLLDENLTPIAAPYTGTLPTGPSKK